MANDVMCSCCPTKMTPFCVSRDMLIISGVPKVRETFADIIFGDLTVRTLGGL